MEEYLKKLLAGLNTTQRQPYPGATPPFQGEWQQGANGWTPGSPGRPQMDYRPGVDDPRSMPSVTLPGASPAVPPQAQPSNEVPKSPPVQSAVKPEPLAGYNPATATLDERYKHATDDYNTAINTGAHHQNPWLNALYIGMQAGQRIADPSNQAGAYNPQQPIQWLGQAKREDKIRKAGANLAGVTAQMKAQMELDKERLGVKKTQADIESTQANIKKTNEEVTASEEKRRNPGYDYEVRNGITYRKKKNSADPWEEDNSLPVSTKDTSTQINLPDGSEVSVPAIEKVRYLTEQAKADAQRQFETGKINADQHADYTKRLDEWAEKEAKRSEQATNDANKGSELMNKARSLRAQAEKLPMAAETVNQKSTLEKEAAAAEAEGQTLLNNARLSKPLPKPKPPTEFKNPVPPSGRRVDKKKDPLGLFQ